MNLLSVDPLSVGEELFFTRIIAHLMFPSSIHIFFKFKETKTKDCKGHEPQKDCERDLEFINLWLIRMH